MDEPIVDVVAKTEPVEAKSDAKIETESAAEAPVAKKKGGRPAGAKDKAPRKKKVVEEPISKDPPKVEEPIPPPKPVEEEVKEAPAQKRVEFREPVVEAPSPRSIIRESARHILDLKRLNDAARKTHLQSTYTRRLAAF